MYNSENPDSITSTSGLLTKMYPKVHTMADNNSTSKSFYVYVHRRATDGRVFYVGKGSGSRSHSSHQRSKYWKNIVAKHGYITEIVQTNMLEWWAFELEIELITFYGRDVLCNLSDGGEGSSGWIPTEEFKRNVSIFQTGKKRSKETCEKISIKALSRDKSVFAKISKSLTGKPQPWNSGDNNAMRRPEVIAKRSGSNHHFFDKKRPEMTGENHHFYGKKRIDITGEKHHSARSVVCIETGFVFGSIECAIRWLKSIGFTKARGGNISMCCAGKRQHTCKFSWKYT